MSNRLTLETWKKLEPYWIDGLYERISLINRNFLNPVLVQPILFPAPFLSKPEILVHQLINIECLDLPNSSHDLIMLPPFLQWTQDVPGILTQAYHALVDDGFFVACFFGQDTLIEFKSVCMALDLKYMNGFQQRFLPTIHTKDAAMLMQRAGFFSPTADTEYLCFSVASVELLVKILRNSGFNNTKINKFNAYISTSTVPKTFLSDANQLYKKQYPHSKTGLNVSVDIIFICGWKQS